MAIYLIRSFQLRVTKFKMLFYDKIVKSSANTVDGGTGQGFVKSFKNVYKFRNALIYKLGYDSIQIIKCLLIFFYTFITVVAAKS